MEWWDAVLQKRLIWALFVLLLLSTPVPTELIWALFLFHKFSNFTIFTFKAVCVDASQLRFVWSVLPLSLSWMRLQGWGGGVVKNYWGQGFIEIVKYLLRRSVFFIIFLQFIHTIYFAVFPPNLIGLTCSFLVDWTFLTFFLLSGLDPRVRAVVANVILKRREEGAAVCWWFVVFFLFLFFLFLLLFFFCICRKCLLFCFQIKTLSPF